MMYHQLTSLFSRDGRVAQLGEHLLCKQGVAGSNPVTSTNFSIECKELVKFASAFSPSSFVHYTGPIERARDWHAYFANS